jgi:hypothetical protein
MLTLILGAIAIWIGTMTIGGWGTLGLAIVAEMWGLWKIGTPRSRPEPLFPPPAKATAKTEPEPLSPPPA